MPKPHRNDDKEFLRGAVELLLSSGRPLNRVADELEMAANSLRSWRDHLLGKGRAKEDPYSVRTNLFRLTSTPRKARRTGRLVGGPGSRRAPSAALAALMGGL